MNFKSISKTIIAAVFMSAVCSAQAVSLSIATSTPSVMVGDTIDLQILMDFSDDPTIGGGFDIIFDPSLVSYVLNSYITDPSLGSDPDLTRDDNPAVLNSALRVDIESDRLAGAAFGDFVGLTGPATVGSLSFIADTVGVAVFNLGASTSSAVGGFFGTDFNEQFPDFGSVTVDIGTPEVPLPAAVWLFGSGLLGLIGMARRRTA